MPSASRAATVPGLFAAVVLLPTLALAQLPPIPIGAHLRVRGTGAHSATFSGRLRTLSNDSLTIALDDDLDQTVPFAIGDIGRVERQYDEKSRETAASVMGGVGTVGGVVAAVLWCKNNLTDCDEELQKIQEARENDDDDYLGLPGLIVMSGTLVGALVGYVLAPPPHWELVVVPVRTSSLDGSPRMLLNVGVSYSLGGRRRR